MNNIKNIAIRGKIVIIFITSILLHSIIAAYLKKPGCYFDELLYTSIAECIKNKTEFKALGLKVGFSRYVYSLTLLPAYIASNIKTRQIIIGVINSILYSSGIFPLYLINKKLEIKDNINILCCIMYTIYSDSVYTQTFMAENLIIPLELLGIYLILIEKLWLAGVIFGIGFYTKSITVLYPVFAYTNIKKSWKIWLSIIGIVIINRLFNFGLDESALKFEFHSLYSLYAVIYLMLKALLMFGIIPIISNKNKFISYSLRIIAISIICESLFISNIESYPNINVATNFRYFSFLFIPILGIYLNNCEKININKLVVRYGIICIIETILLYITRNLKDEEFYKCTLFHLENKLGNKLWIVFILLNLFIITGFLIKKSEFFRVFNIILISFTIVNSISINYDMIKYNNINYQEQDLQKLQLIKDKNLLIVCESYIDLINTQNIDLYTNRDTAYKIYIKDYKNDSNSWNEFFETQDIKNISVSKWFIERNKSFDKVDYILTKNKNIDNIDEIEYLKNIDYYLIKLRDNKKVPNLDS